MTRPCKMYQGLHVAWKGRGLDGWARCLGRVGGWGGNEGEQGQPWRGDRHREGSWGQVRRMAPDSTALLWEEGSPGPAATVLGWARLSARLARCLCMPASSPSVW